MNDKVTIRMVVGGLIFIAIALIFVLGFANIDATRTTALIGALGTTIGAVGGILAKTSTEPMPTVILNSKEMPVPTDPQDGGHQ
jgi:hypothetical protein